MCLFCGSFYDVLVFEAVDLLFRNPLGGYLMDFHGRLLFVVRNSIAFLEFFLI